MAMAAIQADRESAMRARKICVLIRFPPILAQDARDGREAEIRQ